MTRDVPAGEPQACDMNLGPRQRRRRLIIGVVGTLLLAGAAAYLFATGAPAAHRLWLAPLTLLATIGYVQAFART